MNALRIVPHHGFGELPLTREHWNLLSARNAAHTVFQTHQWAAAWWEAFGDEHECLCLSAHDGDRIIGLLPLMSPAGNGNRDLHLIADANSDYCDISIDGNRYAALDALIGHLAHDCQGWRSLTLKNVPEQSTTVAALESLCEKHGLYFHTSAPIAAPEIDFGACPGGYKLKYSVRRHCNRLERMGKLEFRIIRDEAEIPDALATLFRQHIARYRDKGEQSLFENARSCRFYELLAREMLTAGWLHFSQLRLDGRVIATHFGFEYNGVLTWYKPAFDIAYRHYSPGTVLIRHLIDYTQDSGLRTLDFTIGDEDFKNRFRNATTYNRTLVIYKCRSSGQARMLKNCVSWAAKRLAYAVRRPHAAGKRYHPDA